MVEHHKIRIPMVMDMNILKLGKFLSKNETRSGGGFQKKSGWLYIFRTSCLQIFGIWLSYMIGLINIFIHLTYEQQDIIFAVKVYYMIKDQIEIPLSKAKLSKLLVFSVLFLAGGLWIMITNPQTDNPVFNNPVAKAFASYGATILGLLGIYWFTRKLFDPKPRLILNEQGICDNTTAFRFGLIPWSDVSEIYERSIQASIASKQRFVTIGLLSPDKYISKETNLFKRKLLEANARSYGSPIHISTNGLKTNHAELLNLAKTYFEKYRQKT